MDVSSGQRNYYVRRTFPEHCKVSDVGHLKKGRKSFVEEEGIPRKSGMVAVTPFLVYQF